MIFHEKKARHGTMMAMHKIVEKNVQNLFVTHPENRILQDFTFSDRFDFKLLAKGSHAREK